MNALHQRLREHHGIGIGKTIGAKDQNICFDTVSFICDSEVGNLQNMIDYRRPEKKQQQLEGKWEWEKGQKLPPLVEKF